MSGGYFNYLFCKDISDLVNHRIYVEDMAKALREEGFLNAGECTLGIVARIEKLFKELESELEPLQDVWKAMEWYKSCDWSKEEVVKANAEWEAKKYG